MGGTNIGLALSSFLSFCLDNLVLSYNQFAPCIELKENGIKIGGIGIEWAKSMNFIFEMEKGIEEHSRDKILLLKEEKELFDLINKLYNKIMNLDNETFFNILRAMRLFQYSLFMSRLDLSMSYSLLVASIDVISTNKEKKINVNDVDPKRRIKKLLNELKINSRTINLVEN